MLSSIFHHSVRMSLCITLFQLSMFTSMPTSAESILQVLPTRVMLQGNKKSITVTLINRGDEEGNYRMFFRNIRTNDNGEFSEVEEPIAGENFADKMVRFSPRRISVPARSKQSIRVLLRKPQGLAEGEYRSHLVFRKLPSQNSILDQSDEQNTVGFSLRPIVEVTIPVIVRHGTLSASMSLANVEIKQNNELEAELQLTINRTGDRSLYGDLNVWLVKSDGNKRNIGMARGIAVYTPNDKRIFNLPLDLQDQSLSSGKLLLEFNEDPAYGGNLRADLEKPI